MAYSRNNEHLAKNLLSQNRLREAFDAADTLLLDMDGTLLDLYYDSHFWNEYLPIRYAEIHGMDFYQARTRLAHELAAAEGTLNWYCTDHWARTFRLDIMEIKAELEHLIRYRPGVPAFLQSLASGSKRVILVTNAHPDVIQLKDRTTGVLATFTRVISSHDYGVPKQARQFWHQLTEEQELDMSRTMLIDDSESVLIAARQFGVAHPICVETPDSRGPRQTTSGFQLVDNLNDLLHSHG